ncbi:MAG TPA: tetratricopeptide repeat protein [Mycobacterium sp.]|nr:tetratricopeptide repeat protein [Mycobacterium sp.]
MIVQGGRRRVLVVASQCAVAAPLGFLPAVAEQLADVLTDPRLGDCASALESGPLLVDAPRTETVAALKQAFRAADEAGSTLVLAMIGHGVAVDEDFFFLPYDGRGRGDADEDVYLSYLLKNELRSAANLDGLLVLLDTCHAGVGAAQAAGWREVGLGRHQRRYELLTASADRPAYGGIVTRTLIEVVRRGIPSAGTTIDSRHLRDPLMAAAGDQRPQRVTHDGGAWAQAGDEGLFWAHNAAHDLTAGGANSLGTVRDRIIELTGYLQPTPVLADLVTAATTAPRVALVGPRGSGKSTLAAALARPEATRGQVPDQFVQAIAFATRATTLADLAATLAAQLGETVPGFADASHRYRRRLTVEERQSLDALQQHVIGPLTLIQPALVVRLVIDALDELPAATRSSMLHALGAADAGLRVVVTARPDAPRPASSHTVTTEQASNDTIAAYLRDRGVAEEHRPALVRQAEGNWLHARLLADRALRPGFDPTALSSDFPLTLVALYDDELLAAGAGDPDIWQSQLRPVLGVLAVTGAGPVLPLPLLTAASRRLHGPATTTQVHDMLVRLSGLVVRTRPGQLAEHVGLFHPSLADDYLQHLGEGQFIIDPVEHHAALVQAINDLAPVQHHDLTDPVHRYALRAEARHRWHATHDSAAVIESLTQRSAGSAVDEQEMWQPWPTILATALGPEHSDTLTVRAELAYWTGKAGDAAAARDAYAALLPARVRVSGPEHPDTLAARDNLAYWTGSAGDPVAARDAYAELLPVLVRILGPEHPDTLATRDNLAYWTGSAGDPVAARDAYAELLPVLVRILGPEHPDTLTTRNNLANWTGKAGRARRGR